MIEDGDRDLLRTTANTLARASTRIKSAEIRPRVKTDRPAPRPVDLVTIMRAEQLFNGPPFNRTEYEYPELLRVAEANRQLAERDRTQEQRDN